MIAINNVLKAPKIIEQPSMPQNYYGMKIAINNVLPGCVLFLGHNKNTEKLKVQKIEFYDDMWYLKVTDFNNHEYTIRYFINSIVALSNLNFFPE